MGNGSEEELGGGLYAMDSRREGVVSALTCQRDVGRMFELYNGRELRSKILMEKISTPGDKVPISGTRLVFVCRFNLDLKQHVLTLSTAPMSAVYPRFPIS